jgi:hypothetical protein
MEGTNKIKRKYVKKQSPEDRKPRNASIESILFQNAKADFYFYSDKTDAGLTSYANLYGRKITTERVICVSGDFSSPEVNRLIKVRFIV